MKAITLWQPWATLVAIGAKRFETRSWSTHYRGPLAIHAAKTGMDIARYRGRPKIEEALAHAGYSFDTLPLEAVVCTTRLAAVLPAAVVVRQGLADDFGDYGAGRYAWQLVAVRPLVEPVPAKGRQRFWEWEGIAP